MAAQPIVNFRTGEVVGVELLSRSKELRPDVMFRVAREMGKLDELTLLTCELIAEKETYIRPFAKMGVFINLEPDLSFPILEQSIKILRKLKLPLVIEITEHTYKSTYCKYWRQIADDEGFKLALDDFGRGESKEGDLSLIRPDYLKIINNDLNKYNPEMFHKRVLNQSLQLEDEQFIVEKIETKEHVEKCIKNNIIYGQGFLFGQPILLNEDFEMDSWLTGFKDLLPEM
jgi:EAL domain-containing protein (putative c-di-GMP-specific phosphodiesterase class I)